MENDLDSITVENIQNQQFAIALLGCVIGYLLVHFSCLTGSPREVGEWSAMALGISILLLSLYLALINPKETVLIDGRRRWIQVKTQSRFSSRTRYILFSEIAAVEVGEVGDREGGTILYFVDLQLKNGRHQKLFNGIYDGNTHYSTMDQYRQLILRQLARC